MNSIDWARLVSQNRAKALGVPWTEEDLKAIASGIPHEAVRQGILTSEELEVAGEQETQKEQMDKAQVRALELGIVFDPKAVDLPSLLKEIELKEKALEGKKNENQAKKTAGVNANKKWENMDYKDLVTASKELGFVHEGKGVPKKADVLEFLNALNN